jgi:predicted O-linked N-acetylglucosamine transferase (SPINDLY family)
MPPLWQGERYAHERIRIAYLSPDFREHPVAYVIAGLIEHHDRDRFEVFGFSLGSDDGSPFRDRIMRGFERFFDVTGKSDADVAQVLRGEEIDIAVDLAAYTVGGRPRVFAMRPAPVQVNFLGFPGTTGSPAIDYIVADPVVIPADQRIHYSEKVVWLPDSYFPNDDKRAIASGTPSRQAEGLPEAAFVFGSFNNSYKITPEIFDVWMGLLRDVPGSVLWLKSSDGAVADNLRREALMRGIAAERLIFARRVPLDEHLARHRLADLMLDTPLYNAHTTACDALWAGAPFLTLSGGTFAARAATSILLALDMPELVTTSMEMYVETALRLARTPAELAGIRTRIAANRTTAPLFDTALFTAHLESAYVQMTERHSRGEPPEAFAV